MYKRRLAVPTDLTVFGTHFRINGTVIFRSLPPGNQLGSRIEIIVLAGIATINPDTGNDIIVPPGFSSGVGLCPEFVSLGIEGDADEKAICPGNVWSQPSPLTQPELDTFKVVEDFPDNVIDDPIIIPIIIQASGSGSVQSQLEFPNQAALDAARAACLATPPLLSSDICYYLGSNAVAWLARRQTYKRRSQNQVSVFCLSWLRGLWLDLSLAL